MTVAMDKSLTVMSESGNSEKSLEVAGVESVQLQIPTCLIKSNNILNIYRIKNYVNRKHQKVSDNLIFFSWFW